MLFCICLRFLRNALVQSVGKAGARMSMLYIIARDGPSFSGAFSDVVLKIPVMLQPVYEVIREVFFCALMHW